MKYSEAGKSPSQRKMLGQHSTSSGKNCAPYWTNLCTEIRSRLLLPVVTDSQGLDSSLFSTWSSKTVATSWFSTKLYTAQTQNLQPLFDARRLANASLSASSTSSLVECTGLESTVKKSRKIRIFLSAAQKHLIKRWFGVSRLVYNTTIKLLKDGAIKANWKAIKTGIGSLKMLFSPYSSQSGNACTNTTAWGWTL